MIDSHAHIAEAAYDADRDAMLERAAAAGVDTVVVVGYDAHSSRRVIDVVRQHRRAATPSGVTLYGTAGVAPHHVLETGDEELAAVRAMLDENEVVAVGEIGLDYHYDMPPAAQRRLFAAQLSWAVERDMPVVIHSREAEDDVLSGLLDHYGSRGVIHCFTEGPDMAMAAIELGFYVSFAGIVTFNNANDLRDIARRLPLDRILVETDSPYLAPVPHRGKRNEPAYVVEVARMIAELHGVSPAEVEAATTANARALFSLPA